MLAIRHQPVAGFGPVRVCHSRTVTRPTPCITPQITKFQLCPCHRPPEHHRDHQIDVGEIFHFDRSPGSEKYR